MSSEEYEFGLGYKRVEDKWFAALKQLKKEKYVPMSVADIMVAMTKNVNNKHTREAWWNTSYGIDTTDLLIRHPDKKVKIFRNALSFLMKSEKRKKVGSSGHCGGALILTQQEYNKIKSKEFDAKYLLDFDNAQYGYQEGGHYGEVPPKDTDINYICNNELWLELVGDKKILRAAAKHILDEKRYEKYHGRSGVTTTGGFPGYPDGYSYGNFAEPGTSLCMHLGCGFAEEFNKKKIVAQPFNWCGNYCGVELGGFQYTKRYVGKKEVAKLSENTLAKIALGKPFVHNGVKYNPS